MEHGICTSSTKTHFPCTMWPGLAQTVHILYALCITSWYIYTMDHRPYYKGCELPMWHLLYSCLVTLQKQIGKDIQSLPAHLHLFSLSSLYLCLCMGVLLCCLLLLTWLYCPPAPPIDNQNISTTFICKTVILYLGSSGCESCSGLSGVDSLFLLLALGVYFEQSISNILKNAHTSS